MAAQEKYGLKGKTKDKNMTDPANNLQVVKVNSFQHSDSEVIQFIRPFYDACMVNLDEDKIIKHTLRSGEVKKTVMFSSCVKGFRQSNGRQVLICCYDNKEVKQMRGVSVIPFINTAPLYPVDVCILRNGDILVTIRDKKDYTVTRDSTRAVFMYGPDGKEKGRLTMDNRGQNIFACPTKINVAPDGTVAVLNWTDGHHQHLVLLTSDLVLKLHIMGRNVVVPAGESLPDLQQLDHYFITDVVFTNSNLMIVADWYKKSIDLMNTDGEFLRVLTTLDIRPCSLTVDSSHHLWIGADIGRVDIFKIED